MAGHQALYRGADGFTAAAVTVTIASPSPARLTRRFADDIFTLVESLDPEPPG